MSLEETDNSLTKAELLVKLCEYLQGTCNTLSEGVKTIFDLDDEVDADDFLTTEDHAYIDGEIFCCETCGWWYAVEDNAVDSTCTDCHESDEEDEDGDED